MADCKIEKNKVGKIVAVKDQSGNNSTLFQQILNVPTLSLSEAIDAYKNIYSEQLKDKIILEEYSKVNNITMEQALDLTKMTETVYQNIANRLGKTVDELKRSIAIRTVPNVQQFLKDVPNSISSLFGLSSEIVNNFSNTTVEDINIAFQSVQQKYQKNLGLSEKDFIMSNLLDMEDSFAFLGFSQKLSGLGSKQKITEEINKRLLQIRDKAINSNEFYIQELSESFLKSSLKRATTEAEKESIQALIDGNKQQIQQNIENLQGQQRANLLGSLDYLIPSSDYSAEFKYMMVGMILKGNQAKDIEVLDDNGNVRQTIKGEKAKRNAQTVGNHQELSSMVLPNVYQEMLQGSEQHPMKLIDKHTDKSYITREETWEIIKDRVVKEQDGGYWVKFQKSNKDEDVRALTLVSKKVAKVMQSNPWCTGGGMASSYLPKGDFYLFLDKELEPKITIRYEGTAVQEVKGTDSGQALSKEQTSLVEKYLPSLPNGANYVKQVKASKVYHRLKERSNQDSTKETFESKEELQDYIDVIYVELETYDYDKQEEFGRLKRFALNDAIKANDTFQIYTKITKGFDIENTHKYSGGELILGDVDFRNTTLPQGFTIPEGVTFNGYVDFRNTTLPQGFTISEGVTFNGEVDFQKAILPQDFTIPEGVTFNGYVSFFDTTLPQGFTILEGVTFNGGLNFQNTTLPQGFTISEGVTFNGGVIFQKAILPQGFTIPEGVTFNGNVYFFDTTLPQGFTISEGVTFNGGVIFEKAILPQDFTIPEGVTFNGGVIFQKAILPQGFTIPEGVTFNGYVDFRNTTLPQGFTISEGVTFNGGLNFQNTTLPQGFTFKMEDINNGTILITLKDGVEVSRTKTPTRVAQQDNRGAIIQTDKSTLILLDKNNADITTPIHELAHKFEDVLTKEEVKTIEDWSGYKKGTTDFREAFAKGAEKYIYEGANLNSKIDGIFERFKQWFKDAIQNAIEYFGGINNLNEEVKDIYARIFNEQDNDIRYQIIGERGAKNLDQIEEATFRMDNLKVAREMEAAGKTPKEIRLATGWEKNLADQKWRYEILDGSVKDVSLNYTNNNELFENPTANIKLSELYFNQELFKAYPQLKNIEVIFYDTKNELYNTNFLFVLNDKIYINKEYYEGFKLANRPTNLYNAPTPSKAIAHELSHIIQNIEGFAVGSSRKFNEDKIRESIKFFRNNPQGDKLRSGYNAEYDKYLRRILESKLSREIVDNIYSPNGLDIEAVVKNIAQIAYENFAGEVEARNVEKRFFMLPQERLEQTLQEIQDIPFEDQFVLQFKNNIQSSQRTAPQITQEIIDKLKQNGLSEDVFLLSTEEINAKLIELGVEVDVRKQIIGEIGAKNLKNATRVLKNLEVAKKMKIEGKDELTIKIATGWEYNKGDKKWRMEVDSKSIYKNVSIPKSFNIFKPNEKQPLERFFKNKELFKLYPQLKEYQVMVKINTRGDFLGAVSPERKLIIVPFSSLYFKSTLIHEIQHAIQEEEGFAVGGSPGMFTGLAENKQKEYEMLSQEIKEIFRDKNDSWKEKVKPFMTEYLEVGSVEYTNNIENLTDFDRLLDLLVQYREVVYSKDRKYFLTPEQQYNNLAGEVEARNAQSRIDMSIEEKRNSLLSLTEDVAEEDKIYIQNAITIEEQIQFSKSIDKDASEILNVFHGTSKDKEFKKFKDTGKGIFVTTSTEDASDYALQNDSMKFGDYDHISGTFKELNTASRVIPLKLLKENVYTLTAEDLKFLNSSPNYGKLQKELHTKIKKQGFDVIDYGKGVYAVLTSNRLTSLITGETMFSKSLNNVGINLITNGLTYKDSKTGKDIVILNKDTADDSVLLHEFGHIFSKWQKENRPDLWKKGQDIVKSEIGKSKALGSVEETTKALELSIPKKEAFAFAINTLPIEGIINYKDIKQSDYALPFDKYVSSPEKIDKEIGSAYKIYEFLKNGGVLPNNVILLNKNGKILDGNNRVKAQLALGITEFKYAVADDKIFTQSNYKTISEAYHKAKQDGSNPELVKGVEELIGKSEIQEIVDYVKQTQPKLKEGTEAFYDEVLQEYISRESRNMMDEQKQKSPLMQWLSDFWASIADLMGLTSMTPEQVANLSLKDFARATVADLLKGEYIGKSNLDGGINRQIIGEKGASRVAEYQQSLNQAKQLDRQGMSANEIEQQTGWYKYKGLWKTLPKEVLESFSIRNNTKDKILKLKEVLDEGNKIFEFYPELNSTKVVFVGKGVQGMEMPENFENGNGTYNEASGTILINTVSKGIAVGDREQKYTLAHEIQHAIQKLEQHPRGGHIESILDEAMGILSIKSERLSDIFNEIKNADKSKLTENEKLIVEASLQTITAIEKGDTSVLKNQYKHLLGEIDANVVEGALKIKDNQNIIAKSYSELLNVYAQMKKIDLNKVFLLKNGNIRFSVIGEKGASRIQEYNNLLNEAKQLEKQGKDYSQTGWYKGVNGWKYLSKEAIQDFKIINKEENKILKLKEVLGNENILFKIYPEIKDLSVVFLNKNAKGYEKFEPIKEDTAGEFQAENEIIRLNTYYQGNRASIQELSFVLGHEVAHRLQRIENFSRGGNSTTILNEALSILNIENTGNLGEIYSKISKADKSNLTKNQLKIVKDSSKTIEAILNRNVSTLVKQYNRLMGEIDANIVGDLVTKGTATGTYADLLALYLDGNNIDPESIYYISGGNIQFSLKNQPQTQVIEPKPNFNGYSTYKEAVDNTPLNEKIEIRIDDVVLAEVTSDGAINDLVRQGIIEDRRELEPNGNITYKTSGGNLTMKLINAHIAKEVLGGKINKSGDIRTEQKKEIKFSDNFEDNKKEFGEDVALSLLVSDALADNTPAFGVGRIITEKVDIPSETDLMIKLKNLLNELGIKSMNLDAWEKRFGKKANSNALADIANRIVAFAEGQFNQDTLSEETGHFIIEAMPIEKIQPLLDIVHKTDEWREYSANYMQIYSGNEKLVRKEILGKVLKNALQEKAKQQTTLQGQSVVDRIGNFFVEFIENIKKLFTSNHKERLNKFTDEVYDKLMAEELFDELKPEQFEGNKLVMYQAQVNDTLAQSIQKMLKQLGVLDRKLNSSQKESIQKINDEIDLLDEVSQLDAVVGIASVLKKHIDYLNNRGKKQGFLSTEESFVYNTTQDLGKALESILPKLDVLQSRKYREKAIISAKEALDSLSTLTANLNQEKEDRFETIVADLIEKNGLSEQQKDILLKEIRTQSRDTNVLEAWFGGVIHAQNPILNILAKRLSRMNKEVNINSSQGFNKFFTDMKNVAGYKSEEVASLMKKWARGNYIFSPYDFEKEERKSNLLRLDVIKSIAPDVYKKYETKFKTQEKILEDFSKNADIWLSDLTQEQNSDYRFLANEAIKNAGHRIDALSKKEREKFDSIIGSLNLSLKTKKIIQEFKDKKSKVFRESKLNNGFSEEDLQQLQEIQADYQKIASPYDFDGNIKDGLSVDKDNIVKAIVPKDSLDEEVRISLELNEYREALKTLYSDANKNAFDGFFKQLEEVRNSTKDKAQLQKNIDNFIRLNTRIFFTEEFWSNSDKNESVVDRLLDMDDSDATRVAEDIQKFNTKLKNLLKRNKLYNRPSQIDYENLSAADESEIKDLVESLETKFREAKNILPKKEYEYIKRNFISVTNDAYKIELANNGIVSANEKISDKDLKEKIDFITKHVTYSGKQAISRMIDKIAVFNTSSKKIPKGLNLTKEEILEDKNKAILDYAESKLMPYFKTLQSNKKGSENAEINLINEMGNAKSAQEMEAIYKKYKEDFYIDASPSFIFEDADTSDRLNKEFKKRLEENEPLLSDKFLNKDFFNYFGIDMKKGFSVNTAIATKNQKEFEAWKLTIAFQEESLDLYKVKGKNNKYLLPQYRRGTFARVSQIASGLSVDKIKEAFNDVFTYREDNPELGQAGDGEILQLYQKNSLIIPKTGLKRLESTETTDELLYSYMLMRKEAVKYDRRVDTWADVEAMEHYIKGKTYGDKTGEATRTYQKFNDFKRYNIYGQSETFSWETDMFGMLSKKKNLAPAISRAQNYVRNNNLAYNILTPITSFLQGTTNFFVENVVGDRIDRSAARLAAKELPSLMTKASSEFFDVTKKSKANLLLQFMGQDNPSEAFENSNYSKFLRGASIYKSGYLTHYLADLPIQLQTLLTVLHDYRIVNGDIVDYYTWRRRNRRLKEAEAKAEWKKYQDNVIYKHIIPNKGGSLEVSSTVKSIDGWENKIQQMRDRLTVAKQDIDNQISEGDKGMVQRHALLSWTTLHKGWLVSSMTKRFKGQHLNLHNNMMEEGTYRGTGKFIVSLIRDVKRVGLKNSWKQNFKAFDGGYKLDKNAIYDEKGQVFKTFANEKDAKDYYEDLIFDFTKMRQISVIRAGVEFLVTSVLAALAITASKMADDDDDDYIKEFTAYLTYRLASEVTSQSFGIPAQGYAFLENPTVGMTQLQNALDVLDLLDDKEISRGTYKGYTKRQAWFVKMLPGLKEYNKIINVERTRQSYEFYNEKNLKFTVTGQMMLED